MDNTLILSLCYYTVIFNIVNLVLACILESTRGEQEGTGEREEEAKICAKRNAS